MIPVDAQPDGGSWRRADYVGLLLLAAFYLVAVVGTLAWHGLWLDEFHTISATYLDWLSMVRERAGHGHPPLFFLLESAWVSAFGQSTLSLRTLPVMFGLGTTCLTFALVRQFASLPTALAAAGLLVCAPAQLMICHSARAYTMLQFLCTAAIFLIVTCDRVTPARFLAVIGLTAAALYTHGSSQIAVAALFMGCLIALPKLWPLAVGVGLGGLAYVPFPVFFPQVDNVSEHTVWTAPLDVVGGLKYPLTIVCGRNLSDLPIPVSVVLETLLIAAMLFGLRAKRRLAFVALQVWLAWLLAATAAGFDLRIMLVERYFTPALVCLTVTVGVAIGRWLQVPRARYVPCLFVAAVGLSGFMVYLFKPPFPQSREMAEFVRQHRAEGEAVVVADGPSYARAVIHYLCPDPVEFLNSRGQIDQAISDVGVWVVFDSNSAEVDSVMSAAFRLKFPTLTTHEFHRGMVVHFKK